MAHQRKVIALGARLRGCRNVTTLGVRPNFGDYTPEEVRLITTADKVYYPSALYADVLATAGIATFPGCHAYRYAQDKIMQSALFQVLGLPHPRTRVFYGSRQKANITRYFDFPFIAKTPRGSAMGRGVFLIRSPQDLASYLKLGTPAYIQEYLPGDRDIRVVVIGGRAVLSYWRIARNGDFRSNVDRGAEIRLAAVPEEAQNLALEVARKCRFEDTGLDIRIHNGTFQVIEANMKYGRAGFRLAGLDYPHIMEEMIAHGKI